MIDREKVIYDIERCICHVPDACRDCSHYGHDAPIGCMEELLSDALELLKEHEPVKPKSKVRHGSYGQIQHFCGNCNTMIHGKQKYCSECGKEVKWG